MHMTTSSPRLLAVVIHVAVCLATASSLCAQVYWKNLEAPPANVTCIVATSDDTFILGTGASKVYTSTNLGEDWTWQINAAIDFDLRVRDMAVASNDHVYAAVVGGGLYRSLDKGVTWVDITGDLPSKNVVAVSTKSLPDNKQRIFVGIDDPANRMLAFYLSDDDATTWRKINNPIGQMTAVFATAMSPVSDRIFVSVGYNKGLYRSEDFGASWTRIDDRANQSESDDNYSLIRFNRQGHMYVGRNSLEASTIVKNAVVIKSTDYGLTWTYLEKDGWTTEHFVNNRVSGIAFGKDDVVVVTTEKSGTFYSSNGGTSWVRRNEGLADDGSGAAAGATADGSTLLVAPRSTFVFKFVPEGVSSVHSELGSAVSITPNPASSTASVVFTTPVSGEATLRIVSLSGVLVASSTIHDDAGKYAAMIETSSLPAGVYSVSLHVGGTVQRERLCVVR
jgi:photosystem II stability/assembly factor-like uncharacterized protein